MRDQQEKLLYPMITAEPNKKFSFLSWWGPSQLKAMCFVYYSPPNFLFLSIKVLALHCTGVCTWLPMVADLNCKSLLNLNKPIFAREISASLFISDQHFSGTYRDHRKPLMAPGLMSKWIWSQQWTSLSFTNPEVERYNLLLDLSLNSLCVWSSPNFIQDQFKDFIFLVRRPCSVCKYSFGTSVYFEIRLFHWNWLRRLWLILLRAGTVSPETG